MVSFAELFEAVTFFGEIVIGQIGFQVIAISLGRRGLGDWNSQDSIRFTTMLSTSIIATLICYAPFYVVTIFKIELLELKEILIKDNCKLIGLKLNELTKKFPNLEANIIAIIRGDKSFIPKKTDKIQENDKIYVISNSSQMVETLEAWAATQASPPT